MNFDRKNKGSIPERAFDNVIPFWLKYSLDKEFGGFISQLDERELLMEKINQFGCKVELPGYFQNSTIILKKTRIGCMRLALVRIL